MARAEPGGPGAETVGAGHGGTAQGTVHIEVVYCPAPGQVDQTRLALPAGSTLADALRASGVLARHGLDGPGLAPPVAGIWCKAAAQDTVLRDRDRVELYRPLTVDPKEARRLRYKGRARRG